MLKPIKNFFNYLQKNANSSSIFGLTSNMGPVEEVEEAMIAPEDSVCNDPLYDPLALDECDNEINLNNNSVDSELDASNGQIVLVDVQALKKSSDGEDEENINTVSDSFTTNVANNNNNNNEDEEEPVSDGSDSGLGSEPSRNISTLEKEIAEMTPPAKSNLKRRSEVTDEADSSSNQKRLKKGITFEGVTVYYFQRIQGFGCVPSQGGCTLGMEFQHAHARSFTLAEHAAEQRKVHKQQLQELNPRTSSSEETDSEEDPSESGSEGESETYGFLQPVTTRQRRALLKAAGVRKIDSSEKDECRVIRTSREVCGCTCRNYCDPDTCACSQSGIKCQVDRPSFPCGCTQDGCGNVVGRVEFNPARVRTHFIHTIMRLNLDNKQLATNSPNYHHSSKDWGRDHRLPTMYTTEHDGMHHHNQYSSYMNLAALQPHQPSSSAAATGVPSAATSESLDLHYAFRDYYNTTTQQPNDHLAIDPSSYNEQYSSSEYSSYNTSIESYHPNTSFTQQQQQHSAYAAPSPIAVAPPPNSNNIISSENQLNINSVQTAEIDVDNSAKSDFIDLNTPLAANSERLDAINVLLESNRFTETAAKASATADDVLISLETPTSTAILDSPFPSSHSPAAAVVAVAEENLSEVIKNSIVETVSN